MIKQNLKKIVYSIYIGYFIFSVSLFFVVLYFILGFIYDEECILLERSALSFICVRVFFVMFVYLINLIMFKQLPKLLETSLVLQGRKHLIFPDTGLYIAFCANFFNAEIML